MTAEGEKNLRGMSGEVNPKTLVQPVQFPNRFLSLLGAGSRLPGTSSSRLFPAVRRRTLPFASMRDNTKIGALDSFPATRWSVIIAARSAEPAERRRALDVLIAAYWRPVYKYVRLRWGKEREEAEDLTQDFFFRLLDQDFLARYEPQRARLRTFLRVCVDHMIANQDKAARRWKRGGEVEFQPLDFESAEGEMLHLEIPAPEGTEDFFEREWTRSLFGLSLDRLRQDCEQRGKQTHFRLLEFYDIEEAGKELTYEQVAGQFGLKTSDVTNYLAYARREFRRIVLEQLRQMTGSEEEFRREAQTLLGLKRP
jgi:RNA polymerase sigma factor (sigma-70 family)